MPKMKVKATVANFNSEQFPSSEKTLIEAFTKCASMYMQGIYKNDGNIDHLSCNWQTDNRVISIEASQGQGANLEFNNVEKFIFDIPYIDAVLTDADTPNGIDINEGGYPDMTTSLTKAVSQMYMAYQPDDTSGKNVDKYYLRNVLVSGVEITPLIGDKENKDAKIKPVSINSNNKLMSLKTKVELNGASTIPELTYNLRTSEFSALMSDEYLYTNLFYKMSIIPLSQGTGQGQMVSYNELTLDTINSIVDSVAFCIGDSDITLDGNDTCLFYFCRIGNEEATANRFCCIDEANQDNTYCNIPSNVIVPLYVYDTSQSDWLQVGLCYIELFSSLDGSETHLDLKGKSVVALYNSPSGPTETPSEEIPETPSEETPIIVLSLSAIH